MGHDTSLVGTHFDARQITRGSVREPSGASLLVPKVRAAVNVRFPNVAKQPSCIFVDRGKGFYRTANGKITPEFKDALRESGFKAFWGEDASRQPGHLQEMMLHETAVSWLRVRLSESLPKRCWEETPEKFAERLRGCCSRVNTDLDVEGLCKGFPKRIETLKLKQGGRLRE